MSNKGVRKSSTGSGAGCGGGASNATGDENQTGIQGGIITEDSTQVVGDQGKIQETVWRRFGVRLRSLTES